jgi:hypothetical protein
MKSLNQKFELHKGKTRRQVKADWDSKSNTTTIKDSGPNPEKKITLPGLVLLRMTTRAGDLAIEW